MEVIIVALIVAVSSTIAPVLLAWQNGKQRRAEKLEDYKRQDDVAAKAEAASRAQRVANLQSARDNKTINNKLDVIHTLVNSNLTQAIQSELDATKAQLALIQELMEVKAATGMPSVDTPALEIIKDRIVELQRLIDERERQTNVAADLERGG